MSTQTRFGAWCGLGLAAIVGCGADFEGAGQGAASPTAAASNAFKLPTPPELRPAGLPSSWPDDLPVFPGGQYVPSEELPNYLRGDVYFGSNPAAAAFETSYPQALVERGWTITSQEREDHLYIVTAKKDMRTCVVEFDFEEPVARSLNIAIDFVPVMDDE